ncbi:hypothetical protein [uncultured Microbulbifer sp.]|uniref:hypothetical protein n=1 Tax=uncultured Microbulbifer sp. TaxID=348147 RepID=UPI00261AF227|nr:hypothetical protein [uncultured Microbulbifer sp.]
MSTNSYQVLFTGNVAEGRERRECISLLGERFGLDFKQIKHLLSSDKTVVKRCSRREDADKLVRAFALAGWVAKVQESAVDAGKKKSVESNRDTSTPLRSLVAEDGSCTLGVPVHWQAMSGLNRNAILQAGSLSKNEFCVVLFQQVGVPETASAIEDYCSAQLQQCVQQVNSGVLVRPATELSGGMVAGYYGEITAEIDGIPVGYLVACVRQEDRVYTQFLWCESREYTRKKDLLIKVVESFTVNGQPGEGNRTQVATNVVSLY